MATARDALVNTTLSKEVVIRETDKAICVRVDRTTGLHFNQGAQHVTRESEVWLPKSKVQWEDWFAYGPTLRIPEWLARDKQIPFAA